MLVTIQIALFDIKHLFSVETQNWWPLKELFYVVSIKIKQYYKTSFNVDNDVCELHAPGLSEL